MPVAFTKYRASDGSEWNTLVEADKRESLCCAVADIMAPLGPAIDLSDDHYLQHNVATVLAARVGILKLCGRLYPNLQAFHHESLLDIHPMSYVGRLLSEIGGPLYDAAWSRFMRIDSMGREFQQPYYALNGHPNAKCIGTVQ